MRSDWLQRSSRLVATFLLLVTVWQMPHRWQDDDVCAPVVEAHDESKHVYTAPQVATHGEHCAVCHWTRLLKPVFTSAVVVGHASGTRADLITSTASAIRDPGADRLPPRAPPVQG